MKTIDLYRYCWMRLNIRSLSIAIMVSFGMGATGCVKADLGNNQPALTLQYVWPDGKGVPATLDAYFYPLSGGKATCLPSNIHQLAVDQVSPGAYHLLVANTSDADNQCSFEGMDRYETATACLIPYDTRTTRAGVGLYKEPGRLYAYTTTPLTVALHQNAKQTVPVLFHSRLIKVKVRCNLADVVSTAEIRLTGLAGRRNLASGVLTGKVDLGKALEWYNSALVAELNILGSVRQQSSRMELRIGYTNGTSEVIRKDITADLSGNEAALEISVSMDIEQSDGQFTAGITGWQVEESELII